MSPTYLVKEYIQGGEEDPEEAGKIAVRDGNIYLILLTHGTS